MTTLADIPPEVLDLLGLVWDGRLAEAEVLGLVRGGRVTELGLAVLAAVGG